MRISDSVANYILELLNQAGGIAEIQRNELASFLGCVPSQINYVLTSRFTPEQGYLVESRRGGGGYIRITRMQLSTADMIMHIVNGVGESLDSATARAMLGNMVERGVLDRTSAELIGAAVSEKSLAAVPRELRDAVRAMIYKNMLLVTRR
ncbi:CtsR family transcriptional regulator [Oscillospiraceae bacterium 42-9]